MNQLDRPRPSFGNPFSQAMAINDKQSQLTMQRSMNGKPYLFRILCAVIIRTMQTGDVSASILNVRRWQF